jgi:hypothetical protein
MESLETFLNIADRFFTYLNKLRREGSRDGNDRHYSKMIFSTKNNSEKIALLNLERDEKKF